ncbi:cell division protein ZapC domain-containing protein [Rheinheimera baltica]|uniref:Cell division protein ZapC n=1 Tax=Rheinheimera baltica TaxID=67576 RepID=A0ABT9HWH6_9GAMM|nr:cell division protein ZapC domain-containing protein [Rheinheimera baltica]MDP5135456.1 cell division protein ZapC [Rheinheimera baltica]MDP5143491.1 cell division protein ZapC [Rheinheimera baltica]MDP5191640.1 cell division protein ZapC [Rheinheimera baltica]
MLRPSEHWNWIYCSTKDRLLLDISDEAQFCSPFTSSQLACKPTQQPLSMAEAQAFWQIDDSLQQLEMPAAVRLELCLTALCAPYLQQQAHKSWYFQQGADCSAKPFELVMLRGLSGQYALVLSSETDCVTCLLLGDISTLSGKQLKRLQVIRVLRNRISPLKLDIPFRHTA